MGLSEEIRRKLIATFQAEQREHLQKITQGLLALEKPDHGRDRQAALDEIFRAAHSLKGSARAVNMTAIESVGHNLEELLLQAREGRLAFSAELFDLLHQAVDAVELLLAQAESGQTAPPAHVLALLVQLEAAAKLESPAANLAPEPPANGREETAAPPAPAGVSAPAVDETIRVDVAKLDALMAQFSDLLASKIRAEQRLADIRQMQTLATAWQKEWSDLRVDYHRLARRMNGSENGRDPKPAPDREVAALWQFMARNQEHLRHLAAQTNGLYRQYANDLMRLSLVIDELEAEIKRVRLLPLSTITTPFERMVRDLARQQGKQIRLSLIGGETELDKRLLEQVKDPLIHLLRNAVDHGIEPPDVRQQAGKPAAANIVLAAGQQGNSIVMVVSDDGAGLNLEVLRQTAVARRILSQSEAERLSDEEAAHLIFRSGFSTSKIVTDISGRGVGLDVVRQNVEELQGTLAVTFEPGMGTTFTLSLPLTLASSRGLLLKAGGQLFALPLTAVERMLRLPRREVARVEGKEAIIDQGKPVALAHLAELLALPPSTAADILTVIILTVAERRLGLIVDSLEGEQEIVIKNMGPQLVKVGGFAGATILGSGAVVLVLHAADLLKLAGRPRSRPLPPAAKTTSQPAKTKTVLVVDDSITTRTLEKNILEARGYRVKLATNGEEALSVLVGEGGLPDVVVTDVNMPRLNGFDLTQRLKQDSRFREIPVILVTSLDSPADKARGIEVGADAYIVKSKFDQGNLLQTIEQLTL